MRIRRPFTAVLASTALVAAGLAVGAQTVQAEPKRAGTVVTDWNAIALRTVFTEAESPIPSGALYLGFSSLAVYDAVRSARSCDCRANPVAAAAVAAHDVLVEYFPDSSANLAADLEASLDDVPDNGAKTRGITIGEEAAAEMIASRVDDGRDDATIMFTKAPAIGVWRPTPPADAPMLVPWLGFVEPLLLDSPTQIRPDGPDPVTSAAYARDFNEVKRLGEVDSKTRGPQRTDTALFFNFNAIVLYEDALSRMLAEKPLSLRATARLFALVNASIADALITTWRLKYDIGFWRPTTAIQQAADDANPATTADPTWVALGPVPPYPENSSGHGSITNAFTMSLLLFTGRNRTDLDLHSGATMSERHYGSLDKLTRDAFNSRIWLGIHFRAAMQDARFVGRQAARIVDRRLP
jgi:hypothetical protein